MSEQTTRPERKTMWTAAELLSFNFPPIVWIVPQLLTSGLTILVGAPKLGKSWLVLAIAFAVSVGGAVLSKIKVPKYDVLYLALEDPPRRLQARLQKIGATASERLHIATGWAAGEEGIKWLHKWMETHPETKLIVVDTWGRWASVRDGNDYGEVTRAAAALKEVADEYDIAVVAVHHTRKAEVADFLEATLGSTGLAAAADSTMVLRRGRGNREATLAVTGRDIEESEFVLAFDSATGTWALEGTTSEIQASKERQEVYDWLEANGPATPKAVHEGMKEEGAKRSYSTVKRLLRMMEEAGAVHSMSGIYAVVTPETHEPREPMNREPADRVHEFTGFTVYEDEPGVDGDAVREALRRKGGES